MNDAEHRRTLAAAEVEPNTRPIRIMIFPDRPDCILFYVPDGEVLSIPALPAPFYKKSIADLLAGAQVKYRLTESVPGRWTDSVLTLRKAEKAERAQRANLEAARSAALQRSGGELARSRAEAMGKKLAVDAQIGEIKTWLGKAKSTAFSRGTYENPDRFRRKERELEELKQESQALQVRLSELKKQEKAENIAASNEWLGQFYKSAKYVLPQETIDAVLDRMAEFDDDEDGTSVASRGTSAPDQQREGGGKA